MDNDSKSNSTATAVEEAEAKRPSGVQATVAGGVAGLTSRFVIAPLDVVKIRLQLQTHAATGVASEAGPSYRGITHALRTILREEGISGLWKGNIPAEMLYLTYGAVQFLTYRETTAYMSENTSNYLPKTAQTFISGGIAGSLATITTYPLDLLRTRFAVTGQSKVYQGLWHSLRHIHDHEGIRGFYRGSTAAVIQIFPYMGLMFGTYEAFKASLHRAGLPNGWDDAAAGTIAGVVSKSGVFPLDVVRKRLQVQGPMRGNYLYRNIPEYSGMWQCGKQILATEGMRGLYKGWLASIVKSGPSAAVTLWTYSACVRLFERLE
ncbi:mitochondrial carrier [Saitoella complicata NRRL Y-17804]|uniref:Mitochondrial thiamine pyrophosphate carrier 1 n=1 Tax=Saitoella complicata (strain BCRC 22490 / CBS 7301 / JCM 7358 / NBRC 10748 / NRRL Y-17804) TaxID=698492 RepID=A0A0E9NTN7_SAICN|nr:mitochondrial carrier [Saitoella complicata NRRL Y-17804]ODQ52387.1 mitochondrial carrier [Saitoella complicata NRRL Y-17804]GAO52780.1 hypothetical protein G7K_6847-t1 [Saitoella complicata NRRL Y-17804]